MSSLFISIETFHPQTTTQKSSYEENVSFIVSRKKAWSRRQNISQFCHWCTFLSWSWNEGENKVDTGGNRGRFVAFKRILWMMKFLLRFCDLTTVCDAKGAFVCEVTPLKVEWVVVLYKASLWGECVGEERRGGCRWGEEVRAGRRGLISLAKVWRNMTTLHIKRCCWIQSLSNFTL